MGGLFFGKPQIAPLASKTPSTGTLTVQHLTSSTSRTLTTSDGLLWVASLSGIVLCESAAIGYGFESRDANGPRNMKNINLAKHRLVFLPPLLLVGSKESVLNVPQRGQFHAAIRVTI